MTESPTSLQQPPACSQAGLLLTCSLKVTLGPRWRKWGQSSLCGKILFPSESTSRNSEGLVLLAFLPPKKFAWPFEHGFMELLGNHVSDYGDQEPFFGDVSKLVGTTRYRLNEMHSASLSGDSLFRERFIDVWAVPWGSVNCWSN